MAGQEFDDLVQDIKAHGLLEPIVLIEGKILDGRNRYKACQRADVKPKFVDYQGNGALSYVVSKNVLRRHLNESQRGVIALDVEKELAKEAAERMRSGRTALGSEKKGEASDQAGALLHVGGRTVRKAKRVARDAPSLLPAIKRGELTVSEAEQQIRERLARQAVKRGTDKADAKKRADPREVRKHLDAIRIFADSLRDAAKIAKYGKFSPEAQRFTARSYENIRGLMANVEEAFHAE